MHRFAFALRAAAQIEEHDHIDRSVDRSEVRNILLDAVFVNVEIFQFQIGHRLPSVSIALTFRLTNRVSMRMARLQADSALTSLPAAAAAFNFARQRRIIFVVGCDANRAVSLLGSAPAEGAVVDEGSMDVCLHHCHGRIGG